VINWAVTLVTVELKILLQPTTVAGVTLLQLPLSVVTFPALVAAHKPVASGVKLLVFNVFGFCSHQSKSWVILGNWVNTDTGKNHFS
jgi:hypothetical protein